jgi:hypothetical protein
VFENGFRRRALNAGKPCQELRQESRDEAKSLRGEVEEMEQRLHGEMQEIRQMVVARNDETDKRLDSRFAIIMTTMISLTGVIIAVVKL